MRGAGRGWTRPGLPIGLASGRIARRATAADLFAERVAVQESEYAKTYELERTFWWFVAKRRVSRTLLEGVELVPPAAGGSPSRRPRILDAARDTG